VEREFPIIVTQNSPPVIMSADVNPLSGEAPLEIQMEAQAEDSDASDNLTYTWYISSYHTGSQELSGISTNLTLTEPDSYEIILTVSDDGSPNLNDTENFQVTVLEVDVPSEEIANSRLVGSCGCQSTTAALPFLSLLFIMLGLRTRRWSQPTKRI
jgi:hypothetical protein